MSYENSERKKRLMVRSMTAFGRAVKNAASDGKNITVELKSVNNRYLDLTVKISRAYTFLEDRVRRYIQSKGISRGKLDVYVGVEVVENVGVSVDIDMAYTKSYITALQKLRDEFKLKDDISVMSVARNNEVFAVTKEEEDAERDWLMIQPVIDEAVAAFLSVREAEGERLKADILEKLEKIEGIAALIKEHSEEEIASYRQKFEERLKNLLADNMVELNPNMVLTECAIYADRVAIDEELVRLSCHFEAMKEIFKSGEPIGRKLDFLMQEMNRETNTIGSKAQNVKIASMVVEIKSELEKIREQLQNIE